MGFNLARNLLSPHSASGQTAFGAPASPCGCPRPQSSVGWLYCIYSLHVTTNKLPLCAPSSLHTHSLSHTPTHAHARTQTHLRHVPVAPAVLWWRLRLFLFNGACISDAFDNHVHISELSELSRQQAKSDWLCFCLYFSWNKSWMIINTTPSELAHLRNLALSGRTVGQHFNTQPAQGCMNVDIQQTLSGRLTDMQPPCRTDV